MACQAQTASVRQRPAAWSLYYLWSFLSAQRGWLHHRCRLSDRNLSLKKIQPRAHRLSRPEFAEMLNPNLKNQYWQQHPLPLSAWVLVRFTWCLNMWGQRWCRYTIVRFRFIHFEKATSYLLKATSYLLTAANIELEEVEGEPGYYIGQLYLKPHYQLESLAGSIRLLVRIASA
jgi:hypothetical protein